MDWRIAVVVDFLLSKPWTRIDDNMIKNVTNMHLVCVATHA